MGRPVLVAAACGLALAACTPDYDPASKIEKLRVVAIRAEPPEIDPGQIATLTSLVLRADFAERPSRVTSVVYVACVPAPGQTATSPCVLLASLADPPALLDPSTVSTVPSVGGAPFVAGADACVDAVCRPATLGGVPAPTLGVPAGYGLDRLPASSPERVLGETAVVLALALDATPDELAGPPGAPCGPACLVANLARLWGIREHVLSLKRVTIRGPDSPNPANRNPAVDGILVGAAALDPAAASTIHAGEVALAPVLAGTTEVYVKLDAAGVPIETTTEEWVYSWFATAGEIEDLHTRGPTETDRWDLAGIRGAVRVAVVVRDLRGGTAWALRDVTVAP